MAHRFYQVAFNNNLDRRVTACAVMSVELATYLQGTGALIPADWSDKGKQAYGILKPIVDEVGD